TTVASCSTPTIRPRRSSSPSRASSPMSESRVNGPPQLGIGRGPDRGDTNSSRLDAGGGVRRVDPTDRNDGQRRCGADLPQPLEPDRRGGGGPPPGRPHPAPAPKGGRARPPPARGHPTAQGRPPPPARRPAPPPPRRA